MFDTLEEHLFISEVSLDLAAALLKNLCHNLSAKLICRVCKDVCDFKYDAVKEVWVIEYSIIL